MTSNHFFRARKNPSRPCFVSSFEIKTLLLIFVSLLYKTNRFHVAVRLFSNRSQKTSKCGKNISDTLGLPPRVPLFCSYHILTSSVIYYWTDARQHGIYLLIWYTFFKSKGCYYVQIKAFWNYIQLFYHYF